MSGEKFTMQPAKFRILSTITAGSLALAGLTAMVATSGSGHAAQPQALAAQTESFPPVDIDQCPILHVGYPIGGCVAQLQEDLNSIAGNNSLTVDGDFGPVGSQTYQAVVAFQESHGLTPDGLVGPQTKQQLDAALSVPTPGVPPATNPAPATSSTSPVPATSSTSPVPATSGTSQAPATSSGNPVTINCGIVTCSAYLSRSVTRDAYEKSNVGEAGFLAAAQVICAPLLLPPLTPLGVACDAATIAQAGWITQELRDAVTQHGAEGACLKVTYTKPVGDIPPAITWWSTNNGPYCTD
jgi:peptidoglycan hydrolase-like protein with peptidoglycan-binding domain